MSLAKVRKGWPLLFIALIGVLALSSCLALAQPLEKIDAELRKVLEVANPSDPVAIIVIFQGRPTEEQLNTLRVVNKMEISYVYKIIDGVAGRAPAEEVPKIAGYDWVKEVWLDKKVYATSGRAVETSKLIESLQEKNDELSRNISELQKLVSAQQSRIHELETSLGAYSIATFVVGLAVGVGATALIMRRLTRSYQPRRTFQASLRLAF